MDRPDARCLALTPAAGVNITDATPRLVRPGIFEAVTNGLGRGLDVMTGRISAQNPSRTLC